MIFLCLKIFLARILDVSIGTVRTMLMVKGKTLIMTLLAFLEVFIWFIVAREALITSIDSIIVPISYSLGYATGTLIGSYLSKFIKGIVRVEVVIDKNNKNFLLLLRKHGYRVSVIDLKDDYDGNKRYMLYIQINNKSLNKLISLIKKNVENPFIVVSDTKIVMNGFLK